MAADHIKQVGHVFYYYRRVPARVAHLDKRRFIKRSLETRDPEVARRKARDIDGRIDEYWDLLDLGKNDAADKRHEAILRICRAHGFSYRTSQQLEDEDDIRELLARVERLISVTRKGQEPATDVEDALLGFSAPTSFKLSDAFGFYFENAGDKIARKSDRQAHRWALPRRAASAEMIEAVGDIDLSSVDRDALWKWRDALWARIEKGAIEAETANKYISYVSAMLNDVAAKKRIEAPSLAGLKFKTRPGQAREPYTTQQITDFFLRGDRLAGLNPEARGVLLAMIETGMRPSEAVNLPRERIFLAAPIPFVRVAPEDNLELKNEQSARDIPLVGVSLAALKAFPDGFARYRDKANTLSKTVNKYLLENGMRPTKSHVLYSLRHSFKDRMNEAENPDGRDDRFRASMMGHQYGAREKYGAGPSLERKRRLLLDIAFDFDVAV